MNEKVAVIGLGYVGLPLAVEFGKTRPTIGFDINSKRVEELREGCDRTREVDAAELREAKHLSFSSALADLRQCRFFIVAVPTPVDNANRPDLSILDEASRTVGQAMGNAANNATLAQQQGGTLYLAVAATGCALIYAQKP